MQVIFKTNIDHYSGKGCFPVLTDIVPRKGEMVSVMSETWEKHFHSLKLPSTLEVVQVTYYSSWVMVELWYSKTQLSMYDSKKLMGQ